MSETAMAPIIKTVYSESIIQARVHEKAREIVQDLKGQEAVAVCVLRGAMFFFVDLVRAMGLDNLVTDCIEISSRPSSTESTGEAKLVRDLTSDIRGKTVLLIEDICDSGLTLDYLIRHLIEVHGAARVIVVVLLNKQCKREIEVPLDYICFDDVPDLFVIGYGLDLDQQYRSMPYIGQITQDGQILA